MNYRFCGSVKKAIARLMPQDRGLVPSRRYEGAMMPGEGTRAFRNALVIVDGCLAPEAAARLIEHTAIALKGLDALRNTRIHVVLWDGEGLSEPRSATRQRLFSVLTEVYAHRPEKPDINELLTTIGDGYSGYELFLLLTAGEYEATPLTVSPYSRWLKRLLILLAAEEEAAQRLREMGIPGKTPVIRLGAEREEEQP